jgi:hypothetical protein
MFDATFQPLSTQHVEWGRVGILSWDTDIFGFRVGEYEIGNYKSVSEARAGFQERLADWASENKVELLASSIPANEIQWCALLPELGFKFVDYTLVTINSRLQQINYTPRQVPIRLAIAGDLEEVERIAEQTFDHGRYKADPRFPHELAEKRYRRWVRDAILTLNLENRLYVIGEPGEVKGFYHVQLKGDKANVTLVALDKRYQGGTTIDDLAETVNLALKAMGMREISGKVSASNLAVINFAIRYGWYLTDPQVVFHWHCPSATHLIHPA